MKKSSILLVPLAALTLLVAFTPATRAAIAGSLQPTASLMHDDDDDDDDDDDHKHKRRPMIPQRFCGDHCHHHSHFWSDGWYTFLCGGHN